MLSKFNYFPISGHLGFIPQIFALKNNDAVMMSLSRYFAYVQIPL